MQCQDSLNIPEDSLTLAGDERDELAHALLHAFLCLLCNFGVLGEGHLHDAGDWSKVTDVSVRSSSIGIGALGGCLRRGRRGMWGRGRHGAGCRAAAAVAQAQKRSDWLGTATERNGSTQQRLGRAIGGYVGIQVRPRAAIRRRADGSETTRKSRGSRGQGRGYAPLAIGSHRSCSLTSNSYPSPWACASAPSRSMCASSPSGDWACTTLSSGFVCDCGSIDPGIFSGVDDMLAATCLYGTCALAGCAVIRWRPRHWGSCAGLAPCLQPGERCVTARGLRAMRLVACNERGRGCS
jgi:hypothetical protein